MLLNIKQLLILHKPTITVGESELVVFIFRKRFVSRDVNLLFTIFHWTRSPIFELATCTIAMIIPLKSLGMIYIICLTGHQKLIFQLHHQILLTGRWCSYDITIGSSSS